MYLFVATKSVDWNAGFRDSMNFDYKHVHYVKGYLILNKLSKTKTTIYLMVTRASH